MTIAAASNMEKYNKAFVESLSVDASQLGDALAYNQIPTWDSIGHMSLIAACEEAYGITLETDDIIAFSSYGKGREILGKYGVQFS